MVMQSATVCISPYELFRPLTEDQKRQIREAKTLANDRIKQIRRSGPSDSIKAIFGEEANKSWVGYASKLQLIKDLKQTGPVTGHPVRLIDGGLTLVVDHSLIRRLLNSFKPVRDWDIQMYLRHHGGLHLRINYEHKRSFAGTGKARYLGLPRAQVVVLNGLTLPEIHM